MCGDVSVCNNTIAGNTTGDYGGGLYVAPNNGLVRVYNNIVWSNTAGMGGGDIMITDPGCTATWTGYYNNYAVLDGCAWSTSENNINEDPLFVNPSSNNYHLKANSPCINAGIFDRKVYFQTLGGTWMWAAYDYGVPTSDFEGDSRDSDWIEVTTNNYYKYCDMGADEYTPTFFPSIPLLLLSN